MYAPCQTASIFQSRGGIIRRSRSRRMPPIKLFRLQALDLRHSMECSCRRRRRRRTMILKRADLDPSHPPSDFFSLRFILLLIKGWKTRSRDCSPPFSFLFLYSSRWIRDRGEKIDGTRGCFVIEQVRKLGGREIVHPGCWTMKIGLQWRELAVFKCYLIVEMLCYIRKLGLIGRKWKWGIPREIVFFLTRVS